MKRNLQRTPRRGFAMMLVLVFIILFMAMLGVACRQTASALRIESVSLVQKQRDEGSLHAVAKGLALLETGIPPTDPYVCAVDITTSTGTRSYTVTFTAEATNNWSINAKPTDAGDTPLPMPTVFTPP